MNEETRRPAFTFDSHGFTPMEVIGENRMVGGNPTGGWAICERSHESNDTHKVAYLTEHPTHFVIRWQDGPLDRDSGEEANGACVEDVLEVCARRLAFYQESRYACPENDVAYDAVREAIDVLLIRRKDRKARGVLGKNEV